MSHTLLNFVIKHNIITYNAAMVIPDLHSQGNEKIEPAGVRSLLTAE